MRPAYLLLLLFLGCTTPAPAPPVQQTSGSLKTIQDAYDARMQSQRNQRELQEVRDSLTVLRFDLRRLQEKMDQLQEDFVEVKVTSRLMRELATK